MTAPRLRLLLACLIGLGGLLVAAAASGFVSFPGSADTARPRCGALPTAAVVTAALRHHPEVTSALESAAKGVEVSMSRPCSGKYADRAMIAIDAPGDAADAVQKWLNTHDAYGVPVEVND
ncbi:hypothetical protein G5V59_13515 [Nocardioides sp. W3-2-3]|uniref:hypothetical protein n=1 Tax=Nocardioides convexus TaxID=2712224 RepID=UPI0024186FF5|nr:hypothetical protein [Nocardioides convexus]NHA00685.1 hypothetical protein [Nocardioides convexus]